jgi:hypothetical protein
LFITKSGRALLEQLGQYEQTRPGNQNNALEASRSKHELMLTSSTNSEYPQVMTWLSIGHHTRLQAS